MSAWEQTPEYTELEEIFSEQTTNKIGLTAEQLNIVLHNIRYLKNHLGLADVEMGVIKTVYTEPGTPFDVVITHREESQGDGINKVDYFDFTFYIAVAKIETEANATISENTNEIKATIENTKLSDMTGYKFKFNFTIPRGLQGEKGVSFRNRGNYNETAEYEYNTTYIDFVHYEGNVYCANVEKTTPGAIPGESAEWTLMVRRGYGISNIEETKVDGLVHTYTITLESGYQYTFEVSDGVTPDTSGKADKVAEATAGNFAGLDANGNLNDSGKKPTDFVEKKLDAVAGNFAIFDENGDLVGSTAKPSDFITKHQDVSGKENNTNKVSVITDENAESTILYPSVGAVTKYVDDLLGEIADKMAEV